LTLRSCTFPFCVGVGGPTRTDSGNQFIATR
jgi:hypothetical protein